MAAGVRALRASGLPAIEVHGWKNFAESNERPRWFWSAMEKSDDMRPSHGKRLQHNMREWLSGYLFTHWVTLNFNRPRSVAGARRQLQLWFMNLCCRLLRGRQYRHVATSDLVFFVAFAEHTKTQNIHWHLLVRVATAIEVRFEEVGPPMWRRREPAGSTDFQRIRETVEDHLSVQGYATKDFYKATSNESYVISTMLTDGRRTPGPPARKPPRVAARVRVSEVKLRRRDKSAPRPAYPADTSD